MTLRIINIVIFLAILLSFGISYTVSAQGPPWGGGTGDPEQHSRNLDNLRLIKMLEFLDLTEEQNTKFISVFVAFRKNDRQISEEIPKKIDQLADLLKQEKPAESEIREMIAGIDSLRDKKLQIIKNFHTDIAAFLTPIQLGKSMVFEDRFERELISNVRGFRMRHNSPIESDEN